MAQRSGARAGKKIFHKIGEVCEMTKTEPYVLRYWESEFPFLAPEKNRAGQRIYTDDDIQTVLAIKRLLYEEGYTTAGARRKLEQERRDPQGSDEPAAVPGAEVEATDARPNAAVAPEATPGAEAAPASPEEREALRRVRDELRALKSLLEDGAADD